MAQVGLNLENLCIFNNLCRTQGDESDEEEC